MERIPRAINNLLYEAIEKSRKYYGFKFISC